MVQIRMLLISIKDYENLGKDFDRIKKIYRTTEKNYCLL